MRLYLDSLAKASDYLPNQPMTQKAYLDSNVRLLPNDQSSSILTHTAIWVLLALVLIIAVSTSLQNFQSTRSSTIWTIQLGKLFLISFRNESSKPQK
ncbi:MULTISPECIES: hypothetical protein [Nostocaceae]|uniref:hypothetical protein n=1 Tax=Nostocaceae TaxID=1162 RepID=UPI001685CEE5|nr:MULTISPECIES: hypothetical protein [Nostocaceae]MBD2477979.1 hypothetical protein [Anabaena sp. FACHB-83]